MLAFGKGGDELDCKTVEEKRIMCEGRKKGTVVHYKSILREWRDFQTSKEVESSRRRRYAKQRRQDIGR
jgi:hypothetical protein